jgi:hypothetical protein
MEDSMADTTKLRDVGVAVSYHLDQIKTHFAGGAKITVLVRHPSHPDGSRDFSMGDDELEDAIRALELRRTDPAGVTIEPD